MIHVPDEVRAYAYTVTSLADEGQPFPVGVLVMARWIVALHEASENGVCPYCGSRASAAAPGTSPRNPMDSDR